MRRQTAVIFVAGLIVGTTGAGTGISHGAAPNPQTVIAVLRTVNLTLRDMTHNELFRQVTNVVLTNSQAAALNLEPVTSYTRQGRIATVRVRFVRGSTVVFSQIAAFTTSVGAHKGYLQAVRTLSTGPVRHPPAPTIGQERTRLRVEQYIAADGMIFRRNTYLAEVIIVGISGTYDRGQATAFAALVDHRIQQLAMPVRRTPTPAGTRTATPTLTSVPAQAFDTAVPPATITRSTTSIATATNTPDPTVSANFSVVSGTSTRGRVLRGAVASLFGLAWAPVAAFYFS